MGQTSVNIRMDEDVKRQFDIFCDEIGLNMSSAFNIFAKAVIRQQRIPFELALEIPNAETLAAMQEVEDTISGKLPKQSQSVESLFKELGINVEG